MPTYLRHHRVRLALHCLRPGDGPALLLLHGLGECAPREVAPELSSWPGSVHALDLTGHGASSRPVGGGYSCELLLADADIALSHLGTATLVGRGLGAYLALQLAGLRPTLVRGAILCDGPGAAGGGANLTSAPAASTPLESQHDADPRALIELVADPRPPQYACVLARQAKRYSGLAQPLSVCGSERPEWLAAVVELLGLEPRGVSESLAEYARLACG